MFGRLDDHLNVCFCNGLHGVNPLSFISSPEACFCPQSIGSLLDGVG